MAAGLARIGWPEALEPAETVLVKPNLGWDLPFPGAVTSSGLLAAVVGELVERGKHVIIVESDQVMGRVRVAAERAGVFRLYQHPRVEWQALHLRPTCPHSLPEARSFTPAHLPDLAGRYPLVTVPVLKTHARTGISGALKNQWGLLPLDRFAVGTPVAGHPPHRSQRTLLTHWAPASGDDGQPLFRVGVTDTRVGQPVFHEPAHPVPVDVAPLASPAQRRVPEAYHLVPEGAPGEPAERHPIVLVMPSQDRLQRKHRPLPSRGRARAM